MGGVARRATALRDYRNSHAETAMLVVETGNAMKQSDVLEDPVNRWIVQAFDELGTHAVNTTVGDLRRLNKIAELGRIPPANRTAYIATMIEPAGAGRFPVKPYVIQTLRPDRGNEEIRVGILAVSGISGDVSLVGKAVNVDDAIKRYLPEVDAQSDVVVLLTRAPDAQLAHVAGLFPGIDVIINGNAEGEGREFPKTGNTVMVESSHGGTALGMLELEWDSKGHIKEYKNSLIPLPPMMQESGKLAQLVQEAHRESAAFAEEAARKVPAPTGPSMFAGSEACKDCHEKAYGIWRKSGHARAIDSLRRTNDHYNRDCLSCHVTAFEMDRGFVNLVRTPELANVHCEACHGASVDHVKNPVTTHPGLGVYQLGRMKVKQSSCTRCHSQENSPNFTYDKYWEKIKH